MWHWMRDHQREKILQTPFPPAWIAVLEKNVKHYQRLKGEQRKHLQEMVQVFIAEKHWEACGGLQLTDEVKVTVAAEACLLVFALPHDFYRDVQSIFIYPTTVITPEHNPGVFERSGSIDSGSVPILGQAQLHGPVILVWDSVLQSARHPESGHNVVYHEFAHKLDMLNGYADGTPPIESKELLQRWVAICSKEFLRLRELSEKGKRTFLDAYGAVNEAEFFAVITEQFFDRPVEMKRLHPELYGVLQEFYRQDPAALDP